MKTINGDAKRNNKTISYHTIPYFADTPFPYHTQDTMDLFVCVFEGEFKGWMEAGDNFPSLAPIDKYLQIKSKKEVENA